MSSEYFLKTLVGDRYLDAENRFDSCAPLFVETCPPCRRPPGHLHRRHPRKPKCGFWQRPPVLSSCGVCAAVSEVYLRQLPGIDKIKISLSQEAIMVSYKPGAAFQPKSIRDALKQEGLLGRYLLEALRKQAQA